MNMGFVKRAASYARISKTPMNKPRLFVTGLVLLALELSGCSGSNGLSIQGDETPEVALEEPTNDTVVGDSVSEDGDITLLQIIEGESVQRRAIVITPADYQPTQAYPVVLGFHGNGQSPEDFAWFVESVCSYEPQCIAVVPEGYKRSWNLGVEESTADDVAFVTDLVEELFTRYPLTSDFFALGHSNGSGLVHVLATEATLFKGVAGYGSMLIEGREPQAGTSPVSVLQVHGMQDDVIPYAGGDSPVGLRFVPVEESAALWAGVNECNASTSEALDNGGLMLSFEGCVDNHRVIHYGLAHQGHDAGMSEEFAHVTSEFFASLP
jgi:polyhydroxybutyrate depolymerase